MWPVEIFRNFIMISILYLSSIISKKKILLNMIGWPLKIIQIRVPPEVNSRHDACFTLAKKNCKFQPQIKNTYEGFLIKFTPGIKA